MHSRKFHENVLQSLFISKGNMCLQITCLKTYKMRNKKADIYTYLKYFTPSSARKLPRETELRFYVANNLFTKN